MKKFISILISTAVVFSMTVLLMGASCGGTIGVESNKVFYIGNDEIKTSDYCKIPIDIIKAETFDNTIYTNGTKFITTTEMLNDSFKYEFRKALEKDSRIFVLGEMTGETLRKYFGLPIKESINNREFENRIFENNLDDLMEMYGKDVKIVNVAEFPMLGQMIYKNGEDINITSVYVEDLNNRELVADTIDYCFKYDYFGLSGETIKARSYSNSWSNVDITTNTYRHTRATITTSIGIDKNDGNPNSDGEYLFYVPYKVDVDIDAPYAIHNVKLDLAGNIASKVYDYGPKDVSCDPNATVSFQLPKAISVSFTPGTKVAISKVDGGIDSNNFAVEYQPKNFLAVDSYTSDRMQCEAHIEGYQTGSYFQAYGAFEVETYKGQQPAGGRPAYIDPIIIVNKPNDLASGS